MFAPGGDRLRPEARAVRTPEGDSRLPRAPRGRRGTGRRRAPRDSSARSVGSSCPSPSRLVPDESPAAALQDRRAADPACAVLRAPAGRELLDGEPLSADSPAHRATRVAPDVIWSTVQGAGAMSSGGDAAAVSLKDTGGVTKPGSTGSHRPQGSPEGLRSACREC